MLCWCCMLNAFKTVDLILTQGVFVNLDYNLQTVEAKATIVQNKHVDTGSFTLFV